MVVQMPDGSFLKERGGLIQLRNVALVKTDKQATKFRRACRRMGLPM
jgi:hypothetical protein